MTNRESIVDVSNVTASFSRWGMSIRALKGVSVTIMRGEWVLLVGPNGAGKSTLLRTLCRRLNANSGSVRIDGTLIGTLASGPISDLVYYVHQDPLLGTAPMLTVYENLLCADPASRRSRKRRSEYYARILGEVGLADRMGQPAESLSGGERQILALTIAKLRQSPVVLLDEPIAALDQAKRELAMKQITELRTSGRTVVQVTHDLEMAAALGDRTIGMANGSIVYDESGDLRSEQALRDIWHTC